MSRYKTYEQYSQGGQDIYVTRILKEKRNGYFVEVGANNGFLMSNTYLLEKNYDWKGICIEATPDKIDELKNNRPNAICIESAVYSESDLEIEFSTSVIDIFNVITEYAENAVDFLNQSSTLIMVTTLSLTDILNEKNAPENIDYLSIDTNGSDYKVLEGIDFTKYKFNVITIKNSSVIERQNKIIEILTSNGYSKQQTVLMADNMSDDIYVPNAVYIEDYLY
jgi:FkbM family methyltransferase